MRLFEITRIVQTLDDKLSERKHFAISLTVAILLSFGWRITKKSNSFPSSCLSVSCRVKRRATIHLKWNRTPQKILCALHYRSKQRWSRNLQRTLLLRSMMFRFHRILNRVILKLNANICWNCGIICVKAVWCNVRTFHIFCFSRWNFLEIPNRR